MQHEDAHGVYFRTRIARTIIHTAWAQCCLFRIEGNTRALGSGTATVQSRFLLCICKSCKIANIRSKPKSRK